MANMASYGIFLVWISIYIGTVHGNCRDSECEHGCCGTYPDSHCCIGSNTPDCSSGPSCVYGCCKDGMGSYCCPAPIKKKPCEDLECDHGCCGDTDNQYCCAAPTPAPTLAPAPTPAPTPAPSDSSYCDSNECVHGCCGDYDCCPDPDEDYKSSDTMETGTIVGIVFASAIFAPLKIVLIYLRIQRCRRRFAAGQQTVREIRVLQSSSNPQHEGYDQPGRAPAQVIRQVTVTGSSPGGERVVRSSGSEIRPGGNVIQPGRQVLRPGQVLSTPGLPSPTLVTINPLMHAPDAFGRQSSAKPNPEGLSTDPPPAYTP